MQQSLYEYYRDSSMTLNDVRKHYLEHFYYQKHSKEDADKVLRSIIDSTKVSKLLEKPAYRRVMPSCQNFISVVNDMWKFLFKSQETTVLATIDAILRWDIEINIESHIVTPKELKEEAIKIFQKIPLYIELVAEVSPNETSIGESGDECYDNQTTWSLVAFAHQFGKMQVKEFHRKEDGGIFSACVFTKGNVKTYVGFSSKLGVLTPEEIKEMKNSLIVIKSPSGNYNLYRNTNNNGEVEL